MCHVMFVWFLGMNVILSPPLPVKCPRQIIAEELLKKIPQQRVIDPFSPKLLEV